MGTADVTVDFLDDRFDEFGGIGLLQRLVQVHNVSIISAWNAMGLLMRS